MPIFTDQNLSASIKSGEIFPFYFLYGDEVYLIKNIVSKLTKKILVPGLEDFNKQKFDNESFSIEDFTSAYEQIPMMCDRKCILVKNLNIEKINKSDFEILLKTFEFKNESCIIIFYYTTTDFDFNKGTKFKSIINTINKNNGAVCEFGLKDRATLRKTILSKCKKQNITIENNVIYSLIERCSNSYDIILNELEKLIQYCGENSQISMDTLNLLCVDTVQNTAFDLSNQILKSNYDKAYAILDKLFYDRISPIMIMGALNMSFIDMYRIKTAQSVLLSSDDVISDFKYRSKYRITKLYSDVSKFSIEQIRHCLFCLEEADTLLKSSKLDSKIILEQMIGKMSIIKN